MKNILTKSLTSLAFIGIVVIPLIGSNAYGVDQTQPAYQDDRDCKPEQQSANLAYRYIEACFTKTPEQLGFPAEQKTMSMTFVKSYGLDTSGRYDKKYPNAKKAWAIVNNPAYRKAPTNPQFPINMNINVLSKD